MPKRLFAKKELEKPSLAVPVLCRFWEEDGVWNGAAHDLPVAAFGKTLQQAQKHLGDALEAHFEALHELGKVQATIEKLRRISHDRTFRIEAMRDNEMLWKATTRIPGYMCASTA